MNGRSTSETPARRFFVGVNRVAKQQVVFCDLDAIVYWAEGAICILKIVIKFMEIQSADQIFVGKSLITFTGHECQTHFLEAELFKTAVTHTSESNLFYAQASCKVDSALSMFAVNECNDFQ